MGAMIHYSKMSPETRRHFFCREGYALLIQEDDIQMADDRLTGIVQPVRTFSLVFETKA